MAVKIKRRSKYNARKTVVDGIVFDSAKEAKRYRELKLLEKAGSIYSLELQPQYKFTINGRKVLTRSEGYPNGRQASVKFDFCYRHSRSHEIIVEDVKSPATKTTAYKLRKAVWEALYYPARVVEV